MRFQKKIILKLKFACWGFLPQHKAIIALAYSTGMRFSEVCNLKITDIDSKRMIITIRQSKGRKDRIVALSTKILEILRSYFSEYKLIAINGITNLKKHQTIMKDINKKELHFIECMFKKTLIVLGIILSIIGFLIMLSTWK